MKIDVAKWDDLTSDPNGLWYASDAIWPLIEELFVNPPAVLTDEQRGLKEEMLHYFAPRLTAGKIVLGNRPEFFNDDDRWTPQRGWQVTIDTAVIHHTATSEYFTYDMLNALQLLRLYCPIYKNSPAFQSDGKLLPVSSGHFYRGTQTFVGYHWIVYDDTEFIDEAFQLLDVRYTGLHAGHYPTNCRSVSIAIVGDFSNSVPKRQTMRTVRKILSLYRSIESVIGHNQVRDRSDVVCPGSWWPEWKERLLLS